MIWSGWAKFLCGIAASFLIVQGTVSAAPVEVAQSTKTETAQEVFKVLSDAVGLRKLPLSNIKRDGSVVSATVNLRGKTVTIYGFTAQGTSMAALVPPANFALSDVLPMPKGTPVDGVTFEDMAFVYVPKGHAKKTISANAFPQVIKKAIQHVGQNVSMADGLNMYGQADFNGVQPIRKLMSAIGHNNLKLPLTSTFPSGIFGYNLKTAPQNLKNQLLQNLKLNLSLPKLKVPGMPSIVEIDDARLAVVGHKPKEGNTKVFAGVTGNLKVKISSKQHSFKFGMFAPDPGKSFNPELTAESKDTVKIPFTHPLTLTDMQLVATKKDGKWDTVVNAFAELNKKKTEVTYRHDAKEGDSLEVQGKFTLADIAPGSASIPGLTDVEFDDIIYRKGFVEAKGKVKGIETDIVSAKVEGKHYIAVANPKAIKFSDLISAAKGTPLDAASFEHMSYVYAPQGGAASNLKPSDFGDDVADNIAKVTSSVTLKEGLNVIGRMAIQKDSDVGKMLSAVGAYADHLNLIGTLSPKVFQAKSTTQIKNDILDGLDITLPLKASDAHLPSQVQIKDTTLEIKGKLPDGSRGFDTAVRGELDVEVGNKTTPFDFEVIIQKPQGKPSYVQFNAAEEAGKTLELDLLHKFTLSNVKFDLNNLTGKWTWYVTGDTKLHGKPVHVAYNPGPPAYVEISTKMTLAEIVGESNLPGLDKAEIDWVNIRKNNLEVAMKVKGVDTKIFVFKPAGAQKSVMALLTGNFSPAEFVPGAANSLLKDTQLNGLTFIYNADTQPIRLDVNNAPSVGSWLKNIAKVESPTVKPGLNVFGALIVHPTGEMRSLLEKVGIKADNIPLRGSLSPKVFSKDISGAALKNEILDALDIKVPLPKLSLPGVPKTVTFKDTQVVIKGTKDGETRGLEVAVTGEMDGKVHNEVLKFDYTVDLKKQAGKAAEVEISGKTEPGTKLTIPLVQSFELTDLTFDMTKKDGKWDYTVDAMSTLHGKPVETTYALYEGKDPSLYFKTKMTIADLIGQKGLPGLDDVELDTIMSRPGMWFLHATIKGQPTYFQIQKVGSKHLIAAYLYSMPLTELIPGSGNSPLKDAKFSNVVALYNPGEAAQAWETGLRYDAWAWIAQSNTDNPVVKPGLNIFGHIDIHPSGELAEILKQVGVSELKLPLNGKFSPKAFSGSTASIKDELLDLLDIQAPLPKLKLPGTSGGVDVQNARIHIKGKDAKGDPALTVDVAGRLDFTHGSSKADFDFDMKLVRKSGKNYVQIDAKEVPGTKLTIDMVQKFELSNMNFAMGNWSPGGWLIRLNADSKVNGTDISLEYAHTPGTVDVIDIKPKDLTIAKLVGDQGLPGLDDVTLTEITVHSHDQKYGLPPYIITKGTVKGIKTEMQIQKGWSRGHFVAVYLRDLNLGEVIPGAGNSPLKDVDFSNVTLLYNPEASGAPLTKSGVIRNAQSWIQQSSHDPVIGPGMNIFGHMDIKPTGELGKLLKDVGVSELKLPLNGGFSPKALAQNANAEAIKNSILDHLDIKIDLPKLNIPGAGKHLTLSNEHLEVKGKLPDGSRGLAVNVASDAEIKVKDQDFAFNIEVDYDRSPGAAATDLEIKGHTDKPWNKPFGISFLDLEDLTLDIRKRKAADGNKTYDVDLAAKTDIGSHSKLDVQIDVHEENGKLVDATFEMDGPLKLSEIPGVSDVPDAGKFEIKTIKISEHGIEAKTDFGKGKDLDAYLFTGSGWNFVLRQDNFAITEFVPPLSGTPLKHIKLSEAAVVLTKDGLKGPLSNFSPIAQDALKDIYGADAAEIDVQSGLNLVAAFEHKNAGGGLSGALKRLGLSEERVVLTGDIGGVFGGPVKLDVEVDLSAHTGAQNQPKWMKSKPGVEAVFSLIATEAGGGQFDIEIGIGADIVANVHGTELIFDAKTALEFEDEKIDVKIVADLKDKKGWRHPFGIPGFTLYEVGFDLGIDEDGAIHLGFDGDIKVSGSEYKVAADADLLPEALGAPQDIAFVASADKVDMFFMEEIAVAMMGGAFNIDLPAGILPEFTNVKFAFATPGAQDPDLNITGEGFALKGGMNWLEHQVGAMDVSISPKSGIAASGKIDDIKLGGILDLKNNHFDMKIGLKSTPSLKLNADIDVLGLDDRVEVDFGKKGATFKSSMGAGKAFGADIDFELKGVNLSAKKPGFKDADFFMKGDLHLDVGKFISGPAKDALDAIGKDMSKGFQEAEAALKSARAKVNDITGKINAERAKVRRERAAAEARLRSAENRVNQLNSWIADDWHHYHHCHGWGKWACRAKWGIRIGGLKAARWGADEALRLAESITAHFPIDLDPRVAALILERDTARVALKLALDAVEGADVLDKFLKDAADVITTEVGKAANVSIKKASFEGDLRDIVSKDAPLLVALDVDMWGANMGESIAFKWKDIPYDVEQMGVMGLHALERIVDDVLHWLPGFMKHKIRSHIASNMDAKQAEAKRELAKYSKQFAAVDASRKAAQERLEAYNAAYLKAKMEEWSSPLDHLPAEGFKDDLIEVGHTGHCLAVEKGLVTQQPCNGDAAQRFTTEVAPGGTDIKPGLGYVYIKTSGGDCLATEGTWKPVQEKFDDSKQPAEGSFTFTVNEFQGDGKIVVKACANVVPFYWKVLKHGDGWMQMASRATNQCLHFENSTALPGQATAEWNACVGTANQVFRVADSTTPKYYKANIALKNDAQANCFLEPNSSGVVHLGECAKAARYDYSIDIRGYIKFINTKTGKCIQPEGYQVHARLIERECSQLDYQWWNPIQKPGGWTIQNAQTSHCTRDNGWGRATTVEDCIKSAQNIIAPITDPNSGLTIKSKKTGQARAGHYNASFSGTPDVGICIQTDFYGSTSATGSLMPDGSCWTAFGGWQYKDKGGTQWYATAVDGTEWVKSGDGKITDNMLPIGYYQGYSWKLHRWTEFVTAYACRGKFKDHNGTWRTRVGWSILAKECHYAFSGGHVFTKDFEILARQPKFAYRLNLGDLKPVASGGATHPATPIALAKPIDGAAVSSGIPAPAKKPVPANASSPVWIVGLDKAPYAWDIHNKQWHKHPGCITNISVDENGHPWAIGCDKKVLFWTGTEWEWKGRGEGLDIGVGGDGKVWGIGLNKHAWQWNGRSWVNHGGCFTRIDVWRNENPVAIGCNNKINYWNGSQWKELGGGEGYDIGSGWTTWTVGMDKAPWLWDGGKWDKKTGCSGRLDVDAEGKPWGTGCRDNSIWRWHGSGWTKMPGAALDIGLAAKG